MSASMPKAYTLPLTTGLIFDRDSGAPIPNYRGMCRVYLLGMHQDIYTFIDRDGHRQWQLKEWVNESVQAAA